jgi:hypothetical protein
MSGQELPHSPSPQPQLHLPLPLPRLHSQPQPRLHPLGSSSEGGAVAVQNYKTLVSRTLRFLDIYIAGKTESLIA